MTDLVTWQAKNNRYLRAGLIWLRLRLWLVSASDNAADPHIHVEQDTRRPGSRWVWRRKRAPSNLKDVSLLMPSGVPDEQITRAWEEMQEAANIEPQPALVELARLFHLSPFEQSILLLCAAMELDTRMAGLCALAGDDRPYPTFALALALFDDVSWEALSPERALRYWRLLEINQPGGQPLTASALRIDERILNYIKGLNYLDDRLSPLLTLIPMPDEMDLAAPSSDRLESGALDTQTALVEDISARLDSAVALRRLPLVHLLGMDSLDKPVIASRVASRLGLRVYRLPLELLPNNSPEIETFGRLWQRETLLIPLALYIDAFEHSAETNGHASLLAHFLSHNRGLVFLNTRDVWPEVTPQAVAVEVAKPTTNEQRVAWNNALGVLADDETSALLASQFNLNLTTIQRITLEALSLPSGADRDLRRDLWRACVRSTRPNLDMLAQRIDPKATWDDIVLPEQEMRLLRHIAEQVRQRARVYEDWGFGRRMNRGLGISVLCAGESGTGKTMAAEVIANDLQLDLYRIDLSAVVSKYIGETEKNLRRLFDAAEDGGAILFFDEADALFGKRSEVKDSHDRYANIEINYLLQRIEAYRGLALLATNMKGTLDTAFMRRLRFVVNFPFPGVPERKAIWQKVFPADAPICDLDYDYLARLNLSGGNIHAIALNAAFLAAAAHSMIKMPLVLRAARMEFLKLERPVTESDFLWPETSS